MKLNFRQKSKFVVRKNESTLVNQKLIKTRVQVGCKLD